MSAVIDSKVVDMQFNNSHFERNVSKTLGTLDKLKQGLNLTGATKGLAEVDAAAKNCNIGALGQAAETVQMKFSALQAIAVGALMNIGAQAVNAGAALVKSIAIEPITQGFQEYETQMNSVQTILANTSHQGTTLKDVTGALDELNTYADQTIYNFTEMTRNIGTFTAAGVDLDTSTAAIKGIANLAAVSGSSSQQASTAMYQLSQALAAGRVSLMDWNSVVNAGMGGKVFQDALIRTSEVMNTGAKDAIEKYGSFRESLTQGEWLTTDVLTAPLNQFTMSAEKGSEEWKAFKKELTDQGYTAKQAEEILTMANTATDAATKVKTFTQLIDTLKESVGSGWAKTWQIIFGDFEEAKELWTAVSDTLGGFINKSSEARNKLLQGWKDLGGRQDLIDGFANAFKALVSFAKPIAEAFRDIFPSITVENLKSFSEGFKKLMGYFILGETASKNLKDTFKGLFSIFDIFRMAFVGIFKAIKPVFGVFDNAGGGILAFTGAIGRFITGIHDAIASSKLFTKIGETIGKVVQNITSFISNFIDSAKNGFSEAFGGKASNLFSGFTEGISGLWESLKNSDLVGVLKSIWNGIKTFASQITDVLDNLFSGLGKVGENAGFDGLFSLFNAGALGAIVVLVKKFVDGVNRPFEALTEGIEGLVGENGITGILNEVKGCFTAYQEQLKAGTLLKIASAIGILALAILVISSVDPKQLAASLGAVTGLFADLMASMAVLNKIGGLGIGITTSVMAMIGVATAVLILAAALKKIAELNFKQLGKGLLGVMGLTAMVVATTKILSGIKGKIMKGAMQLVIFAFAIKILAGVCEDLGELRWQDLVKGLVGVGALVTAVGIFLSNTKFSGKSVSSAIGILILSAAIKVLAEACVQFGKMRWQDIVQGLGAITVILGVVAGFSKLASGGGGLLSIGVGMIAVSYAMTIFADVIGALGALRWQDLVQGLGGIAVAMFTVAGAMRVMPKGASMIVAGAGMIIVANAMVILSEAIGSMGGLRWQDLVKGLVGLGGAMLIIAVGLKAMNGTLGGSAALLVASFALSAVGNTIKQLGEMRWQDLAKGLIALAAAFAVIGVAGAVLLPILPAIVGLAAAMTLIGVSFLALGVGIGLIGTGLAGIAVGITALVAAVAGGANAIVQGIVSIFVGIGKGIVELAKIIAEGAPVIGDALIELVLAAVDVLTTCAPAIVEGLFVIVDEVLGKIVTYAPKIAETLFELLIAAIDVLATKTPQLVDSLFNLFGSLIDAVISKLGEMDSGAILETLVAVGLLAGITAALSAIGPMIPGAMVGVLGLGVIAAELSLVLAALGGLSKIPGLQDLIADGGNFLQTIGTALGQFVGGLAGGIASGVTSQLPQIGTDISGFMTNAQPFIDGMKNLSGVSLDGISSLVGAILMITGADVISSITSFITGGNSMEEFGAQLIAFGEAMAGYSEAIAGMNPALVTMSALAGSALSKMAQDIPNSGGLISFFTGENDLGTFGEQLVAFGKAMTSYSMAIAGLNPGLVVASATAGMALSAMAKNITANESLFSTFNNADMNTFGTKLSGFGTAMSNYATSVSGLDTGVVTGSANAGMALSTMAKNIANSGSLFAVFSGANMSTFGTQLVAFGTSLRTYATSVTGIDTAAMGAAITQANRLVAMAKGMAGFDAGAMGNFSSNLTKVGNQGINAFINAFSNARGRAKNATAKLGRAAVNGFANAVRNNSKLVGTAATTMIDRFNNAINNQRGRVTRGMNSLLQAGINAIRSKYGVFQNAGATLMTRFINGISSKKSNLSSKFTSGLGSALSSIRSYYDNFYSAGKYLVQGFANGISSNTYIATAKASAMANAAETAAKNALDEHSPSKVFFGIGKFVALGFAEGISRTTGESTSATEDMANTAINSMTDAISRLARVANSDLTLQPRIRPVIDFTEIQNGVSRINSLFDGTSISLDSAINSSANRASSIGSGGSGDNEVVNAINRLRSDISGMPKTENNVNFNGAVFNDDTRIGQLALNLFYEIARKEAMG